MALTIALAGDTMLGRLVADELAHVPPTELVAPEVVDEVRAADLCVANLECCVSERGEPWPDPGKPFFFRAPPVAVELLVHLGVDAVTLANNHALDFGHEALLDTLEHLDAAGIAAVGAGPDVGAAREPVTLVTEGVRVRVIGATDHPDDYAASEDGPGVAHAQLTGGAPGWLTGLVAEARAEADLVLVTPHWGPNMTTEPIAPVRRAADDLLEAGAHLVAGHSAHVFHGARLRPDGSAAVLYDLGDFLDDYAVDPWLRNDLGLLWLVTVEPGRIVGVEAVPLHLAFARTGPATGDDRDWIVDRLRRACEAEGTRVEDAGDRLRLTPAG